MIQNVLVAVIMMVALLGLLYWFRGAFRDKGCDSCSGGDSGGCEGCEQHSALQEQEKKSEK